jgi:hypothetical protein
MPPKTRLARNKSKARYALARVSAIQIAWIAPFAFGWTERGR